jgi:hypothetical protein
MVRYIDPQKKIKSILQKDFERVSKEGQNSFNRSVNKSKNKTQSYFYKNNRNSMIIIDKINVTNPEFIESVVKQLENAFSEYIISPIHIKKPLSWIDGQSILNGKYAQLLNDFRNLNIQAEYHSHDSKVMKHINALIKDTGYDNLSDYITKNAYSIQSLMKGVSWYLQITSNIVDRWGNQREFGLNYVYYGLQQN